MLVEGVVTGDSVVGVVDVGGRLVVLVDPGDIVVGGIVVGVVEAGLVVEFGTVDGGVTGPVVNSPRSANTALDSSRPSATSVRFGSPPRRFSTVAYTERKSTVGTMAS